MYDRHAFVFQGRIAGQDGKTKFTIENASRTRIILADTYVGRRISTAHASTDVTQENTHSRFFPKYQDCP
jgi:hypothetical protein